MHTICVHPPNFFLIIPVNNVWHALFHPKVHPVVTGNWCTTNSTPKPPRPLHRATGPYTEDCHASQHAHF